MFFFFFFSIFCFEGISLDSVLCYNFVIYSVNMHANKRHTVNTDHFMDVKILFALDFSNDVIRILLISKYSLRDDNFDILIILSREMYILNKMQQFSHKYTIYGANIKLKYSYSYIRLHQKRRS